MGQRFEFGRGDTVDIQLQGGAISRRHLALELTRDGVSAEDLGSRNGSLMGERRLARRCTRVGSGTIIVGAYQIDIAELPGTPGAEGEQQAIQNLVADDGIQVRFLIGRGASSSVWAGWHGFLKRMVAIKVMATGFHCNEDRARFIREGRLLARIDSGHVVRLYDYRLHGGRPFLLLEFVSGICARERLREGPLPLFDALQIGEHIARALVALHVEGVIHRDVKPSNILLGAHSIAKLSDFGIAKDLASDCELTRDGRGLGTVSYMAPEQFEEARSVTTAADIYGLGATLYHLIAGRQAFVYTGLENLWTVADNILTQDAPPLRRFRADCPAEIEEFVKRMMSRKPEARPQPAVLVAAMLRKLRHQHCMPEQRHLCEPTTDAKSVHEQVGGRR
jgi:serine/threonine protein kinase